MKLKLKEEFINTSIYLSFENRNVIGKFIDERLYPHMYKKEPKFFDLVCDKCEDIKCKCKEEKSKKSKETDVISINNTKPQGGSDIIREGN